MAFFLKTTSFFPIATIAYKASSRAPAEGMLCGPLISTYNANVYIFTIEVHIRNVTMFMGLVGVHELQGVKAPTYK